MSDLDDLLTRLEGLVAEVEAFDEPQRSQVYELLDGIDSLHRQALRRIVDRLGPETVEDLRSGDPWIAWLLEAYGAGIDEVAAAEQALEEIRPFLHSHGGDVEVLGADGGIVRLRLSGACAGCTASAVTLQEGIEQALSDHFPAYVAIDVVEDAAAVPHPPPGPTLVQIQRRPS